MAPAECGGDIKEIGSSVVSFRLLAIGFLLLAEPETSSKEQVSSDQPPEIRSQRPETRGQPPVASDGQNADTCLSSVAFKAKEGNHYNLIMKLSGLFFVLFFTSVNIGCSSIYSVSYDYDRNFEFVQISTYDWLPIPIEANINSLDAVRIKKAVNAELMAKGLMLTSENPDFLIAADIVTKDKLRITQWGYPYYYSYRTYLGSSTIDYYQYEEGTFILDFIEPLSKNLIWNGAAKVALDFANTPEKRDKLIKEAMQKILYNYPPPAE